MYFLYSMLTAVGMIVFAPYFVVRGMRRGVLLLGLRERFGFLPDSPGPRASAPGAIWVHAVSVGEALAAKPIVEQFKNRYPGRPLVISTTTETGQRVAREFLQAAERVVYFPFDWTGPVRRAFHRIDPALVIILETEIWPNFLREARRRHVPVIFMNSRISERSFRRFRRFRFLVGGFFARVMADAEMYLAQSEEDACRLHVMGVPPERVKVTGNVKFDHEPPALGAFGQWLGAQAKQQERWPLLIAGSVVAGEEESVLAAYDIVQRHWRHTLLVLAPRKPDRFTAAEQIVAERGWKVIRRSLLCLDAPLDETADVLLLDSIGELAALYALADAVFIGGSLVPAGGHNILEPAWFGHPPVFGPSIENFREIAAKFLSAGAGLQVSSGEKLGKAWVELIANAEKRAKMSRAARALVAGSRGATARSLEHIAAILVRKEESA